MTMEMAINQAVERSIVEAMADSRIQALLAGRMRRAELKGFFRHFIVTHLNSIQILSFLHSLAPPDASGLVRENLLEEMGLDEGDRAHPDLLLDLATGIGFTKQETDQLMAESREARRLFASAPLPYQTLKELGLSILLETLTFEAFLSRVSDAIATSLMDHYKISADEVRWFTLHGEVDIRHAEEGKRVVEHYILFHRFTAEEIETIVGRTFDRNIVQARYFPGRPRPARRAGVAAVDIFALRIPFRQAFTHATSERDASDAVVVRVTGKDGSRGYGEGLPRSYVTGEDVASMVEALHHELAPLMVGQRFAPGVGVLHELQELSAMWATMQPRVGVVWNATYCALELALLDWTFRRAGVPLSAWLTPSRREVTYTGVIEATTATGAAELARRYAEAQIPSVKVKVGIGDDTSRLEAVRSAAGESMALRVDANGAWSSADAVAALLRLEKFNIEAVEQPVKATDLEGMRRVREETGIPVIADESLVTPSDAHRLIQERACDVFNIRVSKCGGLIAAKAMAEMAIEAGLAVQIGAQVGETSLLSAAGRHLAAHLSSVRWVEGSFGTHLLTEDVTPDPVMFGHAGRGDLLTGDGLGVGVDSAALERLSVERVQFGA